MVKRVKRLEVFWDKGATVREVLKMIEGKLDGEIKSREKMEYLSEKFINEF